MASKAHKKADKKADKRADTKSSVAQEVKKQAGRAKELLAKEKSRAKKLADKAKAQLKTDAAKAKKRAAEEKVAAKKAAAKSARKAILPVQASATAISVAPSVKAPQPRTATKPATPGTPRRRTPAASAPAQTATAAGVPSANPSESWNLIALRAHARQTGLSGFSRLSKSELLKRLGVS